MKPFYYSDNDVKESPPTMKFSFPTANILSENSACCTLN